MVKLTREEVERRVKVVKTREDVFELGGMDLYEASLGHANLRGAYLAAVDLTRAELFYADLMEADLSDADLTQAWLPSANLRAANLRGAILSEASFIEADLSGADLRGAWLIGTHLSGADMFGVNLAGAHLDYANFTSAKLCWANLTGGHFRRSNLAQADLRWADLSYADLTSTDLNGANLKGANLSQTKLSGARLTSVELDGANFSGAVTDRTIFDSTDLSKSIGLESVTSKGHSIIDINTIYRSKNKIPAEFLRRVGIPEIIIEWQNRLHALSFVYVSYSDQDESEVLELLEHLKILQDIFVWSRQSIKPGVDVQKAVEEAIGEANLVILFTTKSLLASDFFNRLEFEAILDRHSRNEVIVYPVIAKPCAWETVDWLRQMSVRPRNRKPIWGGASHDVESHLADITKEISDLAHKIE